MQEVASAAERAAVERITGPPDSGWHGGERSRLDDHVAFGGVQAAQARRHLLLPALAEVQSSIGWISPGALDYVCARLTVPPAEAYGVATFYALLSTTPLPPVVIHVCDDICCRERGAAGLIEALEERLGPERSSDGEATWVRSPCLGQCDRAPAVFVQRAGQDDVVLAPATPEAIEAVLAGQAEQDGFANPPTIGGTKRLLRRVGVVDPGSLQSYRKAGGYEALTAAVEMGAAGVLDEVDASGLRGRGGAAFPAAVKWKAVAESADATRYLICNADESEPGTFKDRVLMEGDPFALIEAMTIAGFAVGATRGYLYIRGEYPLARQRIEEAIAATRSAGLLGDDVAGHGFAFDIEVRSGQGAYICGEETALMNSIEGKRGEPRNKPPFPTVEGLFGKPTVINNVETLANVLDIVTDGGEAFAAIGTADSSGTKLFCLSGSVATPGVYEVPFGTTLGELIGLAGGARGTIQMALLGGAAGSFVGPEHLDLPLTFEDTRTAGVALGSGVVMLFDDTARPADIARRIAQFFRDETCGQCVPCRVGTVRLEETLAKHLDGGEPLNTGLINDIDAAMKDASICGLGHTAGVAIQSLIGQGLLGGPA
ncbi:MAG: NAD(P)H-dependent oxidoreductase subunit E [Acidimicrobiia bacterium]|nr:NAD(P)H-dependent oxidoreductase subunit E [Acidimicrobiia bacterium]